METHDSRYQPIMPEDDKPQKWSEERLIGAANIGLQSWFCFEMLLCIWFGFGAVEGAVEHDAVAILLDFAFFLLSYMFAVRGWRKWREFREVHGNGIDPSQPDA